VHWARRVSATIARALGRGRTRPLPSEPSVDKHDLPPNDDALATPRLLICRQKVRGFEEALDDPGDILSLIDQEQMPGIGHQMPGARWKPRH